MEGGRQRRRSREERKKSEDKMPALRSKEGTHGSIYSSVVTISENDNGLELFSSYLRSSILGLLFFPLEDP